MSSTKLDIERLPPRFEKSLQAHWRLFLTERIILLLLGILGVVLPPIATLAVAFIIGWLLLASRIVGLVATIRMRHAPGFGWSLVSAVLGITAGIVLLRWPLSGTVSLTLILTIFLAIEGIASILFALEHTRELSGGWGLMLLSGIVDLILAGIMFAGLSGTAAWAIGLLIGVNLVFGGAALIAMALHARNAAPVISL